MKSYGAYNLLISPTVVVTRERERERERESALHFLGLCEDQSFLENTLCNTSNSSWGRERERERVRERERERERERSFSILIHYGSVQVFKICISVSRDRWCQTENMVHIMTVYLLYTACDEMEHSENVLALQVTSRCGVEIDVEGFKPEPCISR